MERQYMPYWPPGQGQYPPIKQEPDYSKMGYEDTPGGPPPFNSGIKREPGTGGYRGPGYGGPPMGGGGYSANVKMEPPEIKQEPVEVKQEPQEERRGEKRQASNQFGPPDSKRYRPESDDQHTDDDPDYDRDAVILDWYNSDLSLVINKDDFLSAEPMTSDGFAYVWHGVRATYGYQHGCVFYEVKIEDHLAVPHLENEQHPHVVRCGWSINEAGMTLGEEPFSYGYGGTGKASTDLKFKDYGRPFGKGDVVGCFLDMDSEPITMSFSVNGRNFGKCYEVSHRSLQGKALFPHILTKNCSFRVNFGNEYPWFQPMMRYTFVNQVPLKERVQGTQGPQTRQDSEIIMMVGLPACGKTTWVEKYCKENVDKKYYVLGTNFLIDKMKVNGLPRKRNYHGRWDALIEKCTKCLNKLLQMSYSRKRNYIIDQTNVYPSARKRKMKGFPGFYRRAVVICPSDAELQTRTEKQIRQEGKNVPDSAIMEMKANFTLPEEEDNIFDSIEFVELDQKEASRLVEQYSAEAQRAGFVKKPVRGGGRGRGGNFRGGWNRDRNANDSGGNNRDSNSDGGRGGGMRGGFGRGSRGGFNRGGFDRGGFNNRGGFDGGRGGFGQGGDSNRGGFDRGGDRGRRDFDRGNDRGGDRGLGGFDRGGDSNRGGYDRGGDGGRGGFNQGMDSNQGGYGHGGSDSGGQGSFGRGGGFGNRGDSRGGNNMDRNNRGYGRDGGDYSNQGYQRDNDFDSQRHHGDRNSGQRDFNRGDDRGQGRYGQDNLGRNRESQRSFDGDNDSYRGRDSSYNSGGYGGGRDMSRGYEMERDSNRDFNRGNDSNRGGYGRDSYGGNDRGYNRDNSDGGDGRGGFGNRDSQRGMDRDNNQGGSSYGGGYGNNSRSYSMDRERDSRGDSGRLGGYGGNSNRGFGSHDNLSRNMGNQGNGGGSGGSFSSYDQSDVSSGYSSLSSSSGSISSPGGQSYSNDWNRNSYNKQPAYWGGGDGNYSGQQGPGPNQQPYGRSHEPPSGSSSSSGGGGGSGWGQDGGNRGGYGGQGPGGGQQWNYGSGYGQRQ